MVLFYLVLLLHSVLVVRGVTEHDGCKCKTSTLEVLLEKVENLEAEQRKYEEVNRMQQLEIEMLKSHINRDGSHLPMENKHITKVRRESENAAAFFGKMQGQHQNASQNPTLKFNQVVTNIGNPYSPKNGLFIAPVPGIYVFSTTVMTENINDGHVGLYVNDKRKTTIKLFGSSKTYDTMSQTAVFYLNTHDTVSVRHFEGNPTFHFEYTTFSGFLLQEDYGQLHVSSIIG